jgi:hypothetical protein
MWTARHSEMYVAEGVLDSKLNGCRLELSWGRVLKAAMQPARAGNTSLQWLGYIQLWHFLLCGLKVAEPLGIQVLSESPQLPILQVTGNTFHADGGTAPQASTTNPNNRSFDMAMP